MKNKVRGFDKTKVKSTLGIEGKKPNGYSKQVQFSDPSKLPDGRHKWYLKHGEMVRREVSDGQQNFWKNRGK